MFRAEDLRQIAYIVNFNKKRTKRQEELEDALIVKYWKNIEKELLNSAMEGNNYAYYARPTNEIIDREIIKNLENSGFILKENENFPNLIMRVEWEV